VTTFWFWYGPHLVGAARAETEAQAREKAMREATIFCDRPPESPYTRRLKLRRSDARTYEE